MGRKAKTQKVSDLIQYWSEQIELGEKYQKSFSSILNWGKYREYYRGDWGKRVNAVNRVFSLGRGMIPRIYFKAPRVSIVATRPGMQWHAKVLESIDNYLIQELNLKRILKRADLIAYLTGVCPIKLGFDSEFGYIPGQGILDDGATATSLSTKEDDEVIEYRVDVKPGMPWAIARDPENVIVPYGSNEPSALPWVADKIIRPLEDVQADQKYSNTDKLKGGFKIEEAKKGLWTSGANTDKFCLLYEIRDLKRKRVLVICENNVLLETEDVLQTEGLPWEWLMFNEDPEYFWGIPDVKMIEPHQLDLNEVRTQVTKHRRSGLVKLLVTEGLMTPAQADKLTDEDVKSVIFTKDAPGGNVQSLAIGIPQDLWREEAQIETAMRETLGFSRNQAGEFVFPQTPRSAEETATVSQSVEIRLDEKRDINGDLTVAILKKWNQFIFSFWTGQRIVDVVGPDGARHWIKYTPDQIRGEYNYKASIDMGIPVTRGMRMQMAQQLFTMFKGDPLVDQVKLRQLVLGQYEVIDPEFTNIITAPQQQPSPGTIAPPGMVPPNELPPGEGTPDKPIDFGEFLAKRGPREEGR